MDTRAKIVTPEQALALRLRAPVVIVGYFDLLRAEHTRELEPIRARTSGPLLAVVLPWQDAYLSQQARAEMAAALRAVDYVILAAGDPERVIPKLNAAEVVHWQADDARRNQELIEHVRRKHSV